MDGKNFPITGDALDFESTQMSKAITQKRLNLGNQLQSAGAAFEMTAAYSMEEEEKVP